MSEDRLDPNTADLEALQQLPGIGEGLAQRIVNHRPYGSPEDLLTVPGLGGGTLERIRGRLRFAVGAGELGAGAGEMREGQTTAPAAGAEAGETEEGETAAPALKARTERSVEPGAEQLSEPRAERDTESTRPEAEQEAQPAPQGPHDPPARSPGWWAALGLTAAGVLCSVSLTLVVLLGINGTLDYGRHAAVRRVESHASQLESDLSTANSELNALRGRLEVIEGLSGRMIELEGRMDAAQQQLDRTAAALEAVQEQVDALEQQGDRLDRIEAFFSGLQELLSQSFTDPEG